MKEEMLLSSARCKGIIQRYKNPHGELYIEKHLLTSDVGELREERLYEASRRRSIVMSVRHRTSAP